MDSPYYTIINTVERAYKLFFEILNNELDKLSIPDLNGTQGLILYNIGDQVVSIGELTSRGMYQGSNISYNIKKLLKGGYLEQLPSQHDKRSFYVRLSPKGVETFHKIETSLKNQEDSVLKLVRAKRLNTLLKGLRDLESVLIQYAAQK